MHLCEPCRSSRDWESDPVVQTKIALNLQQTDENRKARCATCRTYIRNPLFRICAKCAAGGDLCQFCTSSTLSPEQRAAIEEAAAKRDELIDLFTLAVKAYGLSAARGLFLGMRDAFGDMTVDALMTLDFRELDYGRERRPIWTKVLGANIFRYRWCEGCRGNLPRTPRLLKAEACGHWATAQSGSRCPVCAADADVCESCGSPSDAPQD